jgi:hypothetical protein
MEYDEGIQGGALRSAEYSLVNQHFGSGTQLVKVSDFEKLMAMGYVALKDWVAGDSEQLNPTTNTVYAKAAHGNAGELSEEQQRANAEYIYRYLQKVWTKEAICGLLGNIQQESWFNPGVWQYENTDFGGYGILQWTNNRKFRDWAGLTVEAANTMAKNKPKQLMDLQLEFLIQSWGDGWFSTNVVTEKSEHNPPGDNQNKSKPTRYYSPVKITTGHHDYINRTKNTVEEMAYIFHAHYMRSGDSLSTIEEKRAVPAREWFDFSASWR